MEILPRSPALLLPCLSFQPWPAKGHWDVSSLGNFNMPVTEKSRCRSLPFRCFTKLHHNCIQDISYLWGQNLGSVQIFKSDFVSLQHKKERNIRCGFIRHPIAMPSRGRIYQRLSPSSHQSLKLVFGFFIFTRSKGNCLKALYL